MVMLILFIGFIAAMFAAIRESVNHEKEADFLDMEWDRLMHDLNSINEEDA